MMGYLEIEQEILELCRSKVSFSRSMKILMNLEKELRSVKFFKFLTIKDVLLMRFKDKKFYLPCKKDQANLSLETRAEGKYQELFYNKTQLPNNNRMNSFLATLHSLWNSLGCLNLITQRPYKTTAGVKSNQFKSKLYVKSFLKTSKAAK